MASQSDNHFHRLPQASPNALGRDISYQPLLRSDFDHALPTSSNKDAQSLQYQTEKSRERPATAARSTFKLSPPQGHLVNKSGSQFQLTLATWWKESLACVAAIAALLAIFATLYPHQGKPLPQWKFKITINALISIYTVVLKACLAYVLAAGLAAQKWRWLQSPNRSLYDISLYDEASRGPLGALRLLWRLSLRHLLPSLGCLLVILVIFVDPFAQLILRPTDCNVPVQVGVASVPRTNIFSYDGNHVGAALQSIWGGMQQAISTGIVAPGGKVAVSCSTGNCTFPIFDTVGYCSSCQDVSDQLTFGQCSLPSNNPNVTKLQKAPMTECLNTTLPNPEPEDYYDTAALISAWDTGVWNLSLLAPSNGLASSYQVIVAPLPSLSQNESAGYLPMHPGSDHTVPVDTISGQTVMPCNTVATNETWRCQGYGAATCSLYPCIRTYNASMTNFLYSETLVSSSQQNPDLLGAWGQYGFAAALNVTCTTQNEQQSLRKLGYKLNPQPTLIPYNISYDPVLAINGTNATQFPGTMLKRGCVFMFDQYFPQSLAAEYMSEALMGVLSGGNVYAPEDSAIDSFIGPQILQTIYNSGNVSFFRAEAMFSNISDAITNHIRMNPLGDNLVQDQKYYTASEKAAQEPLHEFTSPVIGSTSQAKTCLQVEWAWYTLPVALVLLTLVYFVGVLSSVSRTSPGYVQTWKASPLPLLFNGLGTSSADGPGYHHGCLGGLTDIDVMEAEARRITAQLLQSADGLALLRELKTE